jgi:hypothetical protein
MGSVHGNAEVALSASFQVPAPDASASFRAHVAADSGARTRSGYDWTAAADLLRRIRDLATDVVAG